MQISTLLFLLFFSLLSSTTRGFAPSPSPSSGEDIEADSYGGAQPAPAPDNSGENISWSPPATEETALETTVRWCAVRDEEFVDCEYVISLLKHSDGYNWQCVKQDTAQECMDSIKKGQADIVNLDAGLAYIAFLNYSMKAIANEIYCNHAQTYDAVAVVNRKACKVNRAINVMGFKGQRSCHGGYSTAAGWNYPMSHIKKLFDSKTMSDREMALSFFSEVCAPSEFEGMGVCSGCGKANGSCNGNSLLFFGYSGAFRCLVGGFGDIAFVRSDTALLYSMEGPQNQSWSTKSVRDFMYLCPQGGCREINGYPGSCSFGTVPANVIMVSNSIPNEKKRFVLQTLLNNTWFDDLYAAKNGDSNLLSTSTQGLAVVKKLTRCIFSFICMLMPPNICDTPLFSDCAHSIGIESDTKRGMIIFTKKRYNEVYGVNFVVRIR
ncbi:Lactotransferrin [Camellia lanceoleosa]|uniref:Lactotransferrin n=1 Tax=Camellia lanceoleosa TaxID=1840588 RepID=A0ACC0IUQ1_9ERIC|nr:Lactotransferrin [Camellia lanceoleosa]